MTSRRQLRELQVIEVLVVYQGVPIPCFRCKAPFSLEDVKSKNIENEHLHERELGGSDLPFNRRFSHKAAPCHHTVTNGTKATSAGSSKHRIAKADRIADTGKMTVARPIQSAPAGASEPEAQESTWRCTLCGETGSVSDPRHICPALSAYTPARCRKCGEHSEPGHRCADAKPKQKLGWWQRPAPHKDTSNA